MTTNNITYAVLGERMSYWDFFPAEEGWAHMPVWGFADVTASNAEGVPEGTRIFGYLPPASYLVVRPDRASETAFVDASPHRAKLPGAYNRYLRVDGDASYEGRNEDLQMLLWPLYFTSYLIDDFLDDEDFFAANAAVLSSASSRTASALAYLLSKREGIEVIGLTSPRNVDYTVGLDVYDRVIPYESLDSQDVEPVVYVDMSGDAKVRTAVHAHYGDALKHSVRVGLTHREDLGSAAGVAGPKPITFFAPDRLRKRAKEWGAQDLNQRLISAWTPYADWARGWLQIEHGSGPEEVKRIYLELLDGKSDPAVGHVLSPGD